MKKLSHRRTDHRRSKAGGSRSDSEGSSAGAMRQRGDDLHMEEQVRRDEVNEARRLKELEDENRLVKHMVADLSLDKEALKAVIRKNGWSL
jgi:hypothetical protein